jgi:UDP-N-acetyl-D-galactosamine dehydrogenase
VGFDINSNRISTLRGGHGSTRELDTEEPAAGHNLIFTDKPDDLRRCNVFIATVPTPIDDHNPARLHTKVYPGATKED